jgi:serine/threonine-protein kinase
MRLTIESFAGIVVWNPNGRAIAFGRPGAVYETPADGSGEPSVMLERKHGTAVESWSSDGRYLALTEAHPSTGLDIWIFPIGEEPVPFLVTPADENAAQFSPNGRLVAYQSNESGQDEVYVRSFPESLAQWKISTDGGTAPVWSRDGTELFYRQGEDLMAVSVETDADFSVGRPELVVSGNYVADASGHPSYDVMPDGQSFVMIQRNSEAALTEIHVVLNWFQELNRLVPVP